ncbi:hypothetical protein A2769_02050 [Candidatus Daviesbacteria bacterium RIFCSPHIGHO2_01_FULL_37_27]|nr:MAG: hypothetical protein A2111_02855 [Candidatus Daviesbacteria bacterium GWA1_38_6]OGE16439.1 MAG: hypothetical protein A2769_02050 [Candidatus Daviesbacteria bacterium RIFCSPHIGHO2_01_FULL_37_27]OGE46129.1 MAG: hypothetical protein A3B39_04545 [Candidatus Daviesbacteria bacterium RIFCSPLOWO2_01_FULL_37_10]
MKQINSLETDETTEKMEETKQNLVSNSVAPSFPNSQIPGAIPNFAKILKPKLLLLILGITMAGATYVAGVGYYQIYNDKISQFTPPPGVKFVYEFPAAKAEELRTGMPILGTADPGSKVEVFFNPTTGSAALGTSVTAETNDLGYWSVNLPENLSAGGYNLEIKPGDTTYPVEIVPPDASEVPPTPEPTSTPISNEPEPSASPDTSPIPSPTPSCDDNQIFCQDNVKIWKHSGSWDEIQCSYIYEEIGECEEPTEEATPPAVTSDPTPKPTSTPNPGCTGETYYCSIKFIVKETKFWDNNRCKTETEFVRDAKGKKVKCSCPAPLGYGICQLPGSNSKGKSKNG